MKSSSNNILYSFISHQPVVIEDSIKISKMMRAFNYNNYIICYGGESPLQIKDDHVIYLNCKDDYCSLPEKVNQLFKYAIKNYSFDFLAKFDRTIEIKKLYDINNLTDYCGGIVKNYISCGWHFNKCTNNILWNNKEFICDHLIYVLGLGYVISHRASKCIAEDNLIYKDHVYEDVYIGTIMKNHNYQPKTLSSIKNYYFDKDHAHFFK